MARTDIPFVFPTAIAADLDSSVLFLVDSTANKVYSILPDPLPNTPGVAITLAGNGNAGNINPTTLPANQGLLDIPIFCCIHPPTGDLLVTDIGAKTIRRIRTGMVTDMTKSNAPDTVKPPTFSTTTLPGSDVDIQAPTARQLKDAREIETIVEFAAPATIETV